MTWLILPAVIFAPMSILGMAGEVLDGPTATVLLTVLITVLQGLLYLGLYRLFLKLKKV